MDGPVAWRDHGFRVCVQFLMSYNSVKFVEAKTDQIWEYSSFLAGSLPLSFSLSQRQMRLISAVGTGLLVGTALIVIIPEGIETMYNAAASPQPPKAKAVEETKKGGLAALALHGVGPQQQQNEAAGRTEELAHLSGRALHSTLGLVGRSLQARVESGHDHEHRETSHAWIGVALIVGFILMYLIDALQTPSPSRGHHIPLTQLDSPDTTDTLGGEPKAHSKSTTIGLVIHSLADGIALGASSADATTQSALGLIVFVAILVHKAPAAFGLTSVLLKQGLSKRAARAHLFVFSLAAPLGACVTWALVNLLGSSRYAAAGGGGATWWTGLVLVFSGGTFL
jgi:zinc transporter 9